MGEYVTKQATNKEVKNVINCIRYGYKHKGIQHEPNEQIATILLLQANLGCRINDIVHLQAENIVFDGEAWKLDLIEQKTGKRRNFIVTDYTKGIIDAWKKRYRITSGRLFDISAQAVWKQMRAVTEYLGYKDFSCHSIRKNAGLRCYMASGKDIALVSQFYQHSSPTITAQYLKRSSKQMDEALSKAVFTL